MKCLNIYLICIIFLNTTGYPQTDYLYQVFQIAGSETQLVDLINKDTKLDAEYVYAVHFKPNLCPRCEGLINPLFNYINEKEQSAKTYVFLTYPKFDVALNYFVSKSFNANNLFIDTSNLLNNVFIFRPKEQKVPYFYKISNKGELIFSMPLLGANVDAKLIDQIISDTTVEKQVDVSNENNLSQISTIGNYTPDLSFSQYTIIKESVKNPISKPFSLKFSSTENFFYFIDDLTNSVYIYDNSGNFVNALPVTNSEMKKFISENISDEIFQFMLNSNILNCTYLSLTNQSSDSSIQIISSLPKVYFDIDSSIAYMNQISFVTKSFNNTISNIQTLDWSEESEYVLLHGNATFSDSFISIPVAKGWPAVGTTTLSIEDTLNNPFLLAFYKDAYVYALFSPSKNFMAFIGELPEVTKDVRSGYYLFSPKICFNSTSIFLTDGYSGVVQVYSRESLNKQRIIQVFENKLNAININVNSEILVANDLGEFDTTYTHEFFYQKNKPQAGNELNYLQSIQKYYTSRVVDIQANDSKLYSVVKIDNAYALKVFNIADNSYITYMLPIYDENYGQVTSYSLQKTSEAIILIGLIEGAKGYSIGTVTLN